MCKLMFIFFLCRLKTPDEWRISYGRSDVCASDLIPIAPCGGGSSRTVSRSSTTTMRGALRWPAAAAYGVSVAARRMENSANRRFFELDPDIIDPLGYDLLTHQRFTFTVLTPVRSEEHTSELQSLMRISYAVFCLKKKTKKQHENIITDTLTKAHSDEQHMTHITTKKTHILME